MVVLRLQFLVVRISFWLSVLGLHVQSRVLASDLRLSVGQLHQYLWLSGDFFGYPGLTDSQNFERW